MSESKIEIKIGQIMFSGQGDQDWLAKQLDKILSQAEKLIKIAPVSGGSGDAETRDVIKVDDSSIAKKTLRTFLQEKNAISNQVKKFLATALWLEAKGQKRNQTNDVTKALKDASQTRLTNPASCLGKNVTKGYCEKDGKQFFVTDEGKSSL